MHIEIRWRDLEAAWHMLAAPEKQAHVDDTLVALKALYQSVGPEKAVFTLVAATAWLTDESPPPEGGWQP